MRTLGSALLVSLLIVANQSAALAAGHSGNSAYKIGLSQFKARNYGFAEKYFEQAAKQNPSDAMSRYYLANCLVHLKRHKEAMKQYQMCYQLEPYGVVSGFCRRALLAYNVPLESPRLAVLPSASKRPAEQPPGENSKQFDSALMMIRRQAEMEKSRNRDYADDLAKNVVESGKVKARRIKARAEDEIRYLYSGGPYADDRGTVRGQMAPIWRLRPVDQQYVKDQADQIRKEAEDRAKVEEQLSEEKSKEYKSWSQNRQDTLDQVADNLESQLKGKTVEEGVKLNPVGTGLYVRNYVSPKGRSKYADARPSVVRFVNKLSDDASVAEESPSPAMESEEGTLRHSQVSGKVLTK